jgi:hypothetical protein
VPTRICSCVASDERIRRTEESVPPTPARPLCQRSLPDTRRPLPAHGDSPRGRVPRRALGARDFARNPLPPRPPGPRVHRRRRRFSRLRKSSRVGWSVTVRSSHGLQRAVARPERG